MSYWLMRKAQARVSWLLASYKWADQARWIAFVLFYAVLSNVPYWIASRYLGLLPLGWFCIEYAVVGLLALFLPRIFIAPLLLMAMAADLTSGVSKTYYLAPTECLQNLALLHELPFSRLFAVLGVGLLVASLAAVATFFPTAKMRGVFALRAAVCLSIFVCCAAAMDYLSVSREVGQFSNPMRTFRPGDTNRFSSADSMWLGRYPALRLSRDQKLFGIPRTLVSSHISDFASTPSASGTAIDVIDRNLDDSADSRSNALRPNVVVVLLESWGIDHDLLVRDSLVHPYTDFKLLARYRVSQGMVPFNGPTVSGEGRELCGSKIGMQILNISRGDVSSCLPARLSAAGYRSVALHGMDGHMFRRIDWYNSIGFKEQWFRDSFKGLGLPDCVGAFTGICDASIAQWIGDRLDKREAQPEFMYWVTLNSHLPVRVPSAVLDGASCTVSPSLADQPALCSWYQLVENVHRSIARVAMTSLARPTIFVVVGDHAPPFANPKLRSQFSSSDVPYVVLSPRSDIHSGMQVSKVLGAVFGAKPS